MNMTGACLSRAQLNYSEGLQQLWLKGAQLIGTEFTGSNLRASDLQDAQGGIDLTDWWRSGNDQAEIEKDGYDAVWRIFNTIQQWHWANFRGATLDSVVANRAHLNRSYAVQPRSSRTFSSAGRITLSPRSTSNCS